MSNDNDPVKPQHIEFYQEELETFQLQDTYQPILDGYYTEE